MENSLPKLAVSDPAQILIHPEHAQGNLKVPSPQQKKSPHTLLNIISVFLIVFLLSLLLAAYFLIPKTRTVIYARSTAETFSTVSEKTDKVDTSLKSLYQLVTAGAATESTTQIGNGVLAAQDSAQNDFADSAVLVLTAAKSSTSQDGRVKGFSIPESDPNKGTRTQRQVAKDIDTKKKEADSAANLIDSLANEQVSDSAKDLKQDITSVKLKTDKYLSEAGKTSAFYVKISDASLELYNLSTSINSSADIKNAISKLTSLRGDFADGESSLPEEMSSLNKDVVGIFDLLIGYFKDLDSGKFTTGAALYNSYVEFLAQAKTITAQTQVHEINFWQNNEALANYKDLSAEQSELIKEATAVKKQNNYFLMPLLGVN